METTDTTVAPEQKDPGFFESMLNGAKDLGQTGLQLISDSSTIGGLLMLPTGTKPTWLTERQEQREQNRQRFAWEKENQEFRREQQAQQLRINPLIKEHYRLANQGFRLNIAQRYYMDNEKTALTGVEQLLEPLGGTDADKTKTMRSQAVRDLVDSQTIGSLILTGNPELKEYARTRANLLGINIEEKEGEFYISTKAMKEPVKVTPELIGEMHTMLQKAVATEHAAVVAMNERNRDVIGYTQNDRINGLVRAGFGTAQATQQVQAFLGNYSEKQVREHAVWNALTKIFEDGVMSAEEKAKYAPQLEYLATNMGKKWIVDAETGEYSIDGIPVRKYAAGELANHRLEIEWQERLNATKEGQKALLAAEMAKRGKGGENQEEIQKANNKAAHDDLDRMYGIEYNELSDEQQGKLTSAYQNRAAQLLARGIIDEQGNVVSNDRETLEMEDRKWKVALNKLGLDEKKFPSLLRAKLDDFKLDDTEKELAALEKEQKQTFAQMQELRKKHGGQAPPVAQSAPLIGGPGAGSSYVGTQRGQQPLSVDEGSKFHGLNTRFKHQEEQIQERRKKLASRKKRTAKAQDDK